MPRTARPVVRTVELSLMQSDYFAAKEYRDALRTYPEDRGWLEVNDFLTTQRILDRYTITRD
jgi:hypothetical protein